MRIGMVTGEFPPMVGGIGDYTFQLTQALKSPANELFLFGPQEAESNDATLHITRTNEWGITTPLAVRQWAQANQLDVINIQYQTAAFQMSPWIHFIPQVAPCPVITTFHDLRFPYLFPKAGKLRQWIVNHLASKSAGVIMTNDDDFSRLTHHHRALIPIGSNIANVSLSEKDYAHWRQSAGAQPDDYLILFFGFVHPTKGMIHLLDAIHLLHQHNVPARLVIVGGQEHPGDASVAAHVKQVKTHIQTQGLSSSVHWTGYVSDQDVSRYLTVADVVALPFTEGASLRNGSLIAAIMHGCAVITTHPTANSQLLRNGENMLLVTPRNTDDLVTALQNLYHEANLRNQIKTGVRALQHQFSWDQIATQTVNFYQQIIMKRKTTS